MNLINVSPVRHRSIYNFCAGPAVLPDPVLDQIQSQLKNGLNGMSPFSVSHRGPEFMEIVERSEFNLRTLLNIPSDYHVLFVAGGASMQFSMVPMNLLGAHETADYVVTGQWSEKAFEEGLRFAPMRLASHAGPEFNRIPAVATWQINPAAAFLHYTPNETIDGIQFSEIPKVPLPLVADCSSEFLSKPMDVSRFALIYAGAQKNIGPAGLSIVIVHRDFVGLASRGIPSLCDYASYAQTQSIYNTPPTFSWYIVDLVLQWFLLEGGLTEIERRNRKKAQLLYAAIERSGGFYSNRVPSQLRSMMNVIFHLPNSALEDAFVAGAEQRGLMNLAGHRCKGGIRASLYNAMPEAGVHALIDWMHYFQEQNA